MRARNKNQSGTGLCGPTHSATFIVSVRAAVYIDGALSFETTENVPAAILNVDRSLRRGINGTVVFQGVLDEVRIYNRALGATEIVALQAGTQWE